MTQKKSADTLKQEALTVLVQWRGADKAVISDKSNEVKQRVLSNARRNLRTAADNLDEVQHG